VRRSQEFIGPIGSPVGMAALSERVESMTFADSVHRGDGADAVEMVVMEVFDVLRRTRLWTDHHGADDLPIHLE
jgi:hypothetical protein